tara:strand:- start:403 stop:597 length:195 start_codon:yes stop_codon:yes gene_type:complete
MKITKTSMFTNKESTMEIDITQEQLDAWHNGMLIQEAMPNISAEEREFIMTGTTPEDWSKMNDE